MKTILAVLLFAGSLVASAQVFNKTVSPGSGNQATLEVDGVAGKVTVIEGMCWSAASTTTTSQTVMGLVIYNGAVGSANYHGLWSSMVAVAASSGLGGNVVPLFCTPPNMKFTSTTGEDLYVYFTTALSGIAESITVSGHYE